MSLNVDDKTNKIVENVPGENTSSTGDKVKATTPTIKYKGTVTVKYVDKKGRVKRVQRGHNAGEQGLFTLITQSLCSSSGAPSYAPKAIMGYYKDDNNNEVKAFLNKVSMAGTPVIYDSLGRKTPNEGVSAQFSFLIPDGSLRQREKPITKLCLVNTHYEDEEDSPPSYSICATFEYENGEGAISTDTTNNIVIYWLMSFSNVSDLNNDD